MMTGSDAHEPLSELFTAWLTFLARAEEAALKGDRSCAFHRIQGAEVFHLLSEEEKRAAIEVGRALVPLWTRKNIVRRDA